MLGSHKHFNLFLAVGPTLAVVFGTGAVIGLLFPSLAGLAGWLMLIPLLPVIGALAFGVVAGLIGHFLR